MNPSEAQTIMMPINTLIPYARNPRKNDAAVDRMCGSIREFGFKVPILARSTGDVVDGHLRLKAALKLQIETVPVILCDEWTDAQVRAFRLLVNRSVTWADWDEELLAAELRELRQSGFDLDLTGFDEHELQQLLSPINSGLTNDDAVPDIPKEPLTRPGDTWILDNHRLICGDATSPADVQKLFGELRPGVMVTDPPYGVNYRPSWRNEAARAGKISYSARREGKVTNDDRIDWSEAYSLFPGSIIYVWHASLFGSEIQHSLENSGFELRSQIVWAKSRFAISRGHYHWQHECCFYAVRKGSNGNWCGDRSQTTLWTVSSSPNNEDKNNHATQKPVELMRRPVLNHTNPGQCVYDPFVGTGTTIIAAETTGRICYAIEIDPAYVDVAVKRWQEFGGKQAFLETNGRTFAQLAAEGRR